MSAITEDKVGKVSRTRYEELVADGLEQLAVAGAAQMRLGDFALEIAPMGPHGWWQDGPSTEPPGTREALAQYAADVDVELNTLRDRRWVASRWPKQHRRDGIGYAVYKALAAIQDEQERFAKLGDPPWHERSGTYRWTENAAKQAVGQKTSYQPQTVQEKVNRVHDLVQDEEVAVQIASSLLRRPTVVEDVVADATVMHIVNTAQAERSKAVAKKRVEAQPGDTEAVAKAKKAVKQVAARIAHTSEFVDLIGACAVFVAAAGRIVPTLDEHHFTPEERATIHTNLERVHGAAEWIEVAVDTGRVSLDAGLAALLKGQ